MFKPFYIISGLSLDVYVCVLERGKLLEFVNLLVSPIRRDFVMTMTTNNEMKAPNI